jgi:hypothetical protein
MNDFQSKPKRELRWRDIWWPVYFFFWKHTAFIRRIWCKHGGVYMAGTDTNFVTVCANCYSPDVPQMANGLDPKFVGVIAFNPSGVKRLTVEGRFDKPEEKTND